MRQKRTSKAWTAPRAEQRRVMPQLDARLAKAALALAAAVVVVGAIRMALAV
jgi:hypothetical protein